MQVLLSKEAQKNYNHLPKVQQSKIKKKLTALQEDPYLGKKLDGELKDDRSLRAWPYRIIYSIDKEKNKILVSTILHRQGAYN